MAFKMKGSSYKMGGHKTKATMAYMKNMKSPLEQASVDHQEIKDRLKGEDLTEAERQAILAKLKAAYEKEKEEESKEKAPTEMKSPMKDQRGTHIKEDKKQHTDADHTWESQGAPAKK